MPKRRVQKLNDAHLANKDTLFCELAQQTEIIKKSLCCIRMLREAPPKFNIWKCDKTFRIGMHLQGTWVLSNMQAKYQSQEHISNSTRQLWVVKKRKWGT